MYRKTYLEVDLNSILSNYNAVQSIVKNKLVIPVVKANAYGHGVLKVVEKLYQNGVRFFAVSLLEEALEIRKQFPTVELMMMGVCNPGDFLVAASHNIQITIGNMTQYQELLKIKKDIKIHLKIDTGMHRLGFVDYDEAKDIVDQLSNHHYAKLVGVYTHFATADNNYEYYEMQKIQFESFLSRIDHTRLMIHASNSSSAIKYESNFAYTTHVRLGISLYGLTLDEETKFLENTCRLISHISEVKVLKKGDKLGYGVTYEALEDEYIGVLPIGYADGFIRKNQGGFVEINGQKHEIIGRICMDQMFVRIHENIRLDTPVILFGGLVSIDDVAKRLETINYEVICQITSRVPRTYK